MSETYVPRNRMAVSSLVMGVITILTAWIPFLNFLSLLMGPLGIIFGYVAIRQIKQAQTPVKGSRMALTGLLLSVAGTVLTIGILIVLMTFLSGLTV